jgi:murein DD-endopeptidase MepM/ murein hydrolase activator NlpD
VKPLRLLPPAALAVAVVGIAAAAPAEPAVSTAIAFVVQISVPGQSSVSAGAISAPPNAIDNAGAFTYPADGTVARVGSGVSNAVVQAGTSASAQATATALGVTLFGGEVAVESVDVRATAAAGAVNATGDASASTVNGLTILGQPLTPSPGVQVPLADWGTLEVLAQATETSAQPPRRARAAVTALRLRLVADHGGLPAGSEIMIASVEAVAAVTPVPETPPVRPGQPPPAPGASPRPSAPPRGSGQPAAPGSGISGYLPGGVTVAPRPRPNVGLDPGQTIPGRPPELVRPAPEVVARFTAGGYVFPLFGPASHGDSFGAPRSDVSGGWHHGEDIFAPEGTPILAVADGTVFSVGWNDLGGWKLWLRDAQGNEFYYAHLSAFSPLAVDGGRVRAGEVLGFVGNTGATGAMHLHFEIHPVELLSFGYDGAIAPYPFLIAWRRAEDVSFAAGRRFTVSPRDGLPRSTAPPAGAILLLADDISRTSGLVPGALKRALDGAKADEAQLVPRSG